MSNELENDNSSTVAETTENQEVQDVEEVEETTETTETVDTTEDVETLKKTIKTLEAQKNHWKDKANKPAEVSVKETPKAAKQEELSTRDVFVLVKNNVAEEDIQDVVDYAKMKKITVADALKSSFVKSILKDKEQERQTASATSTGASRRTVSKVSDETILSKASSKGELPDSDDDMARLIKARKGLK